MEQPLDATTAIARARAVLSYYGAIYPDANLLEAALDNRAAPATIESLYHAAMARADAIDCPDVEPEWDAVYRAADAIEAAWLSLQEVVDVEAFECAVASAEEGRMTLNLQIFDPKTGKWV